MTDWQPIETAPKDGTPILLAGGEDDNSCYADGKDYENMQSPCRGWWDGSDWMITLAEACCVGVVRENPTHWMPLPPVPAQADRSPQGGDAAGGSIHEGTVPHSGNAPLTPCNQDTTNG